MGQSLSQIYLHIVYSTKNRAAFMQHKPLRERIHAYLAGICQNLQSPALIIGGVADHVHILCRLARTVTVANLLQELKSESSGWVKNQDPSMAGFAWQNGYGAFSVSPGHVDALRDYIVHQEEHHLKESFQDEYRRLLKKYGMECDERYVWD